MYLKAALRGGLHGLRIYTGREFLEGPARVWVIDSVRRLYHSDIVTYITKKY